MRKIILLLVIVLSLISCEKEFISPIEATDYLGYWSLVGRDDIVLHIEDTCITELSYSRREFYDLIITDEGISYSEHGPYPDTWANHEGTLNHTGDTLTTMIVYCVIWGVEQDVSTYPIKQWR